LKVGKHRTNKTIRGAGRSAKNHDRRVSNPRTQCERVFAMAGNEWEKRKGGGSDTKEVNVTSSQRWGVVSRHPRCLSVIRENDAPKGRKSGTNAREKMLPT